jgi:PHD/YefM family antitoxin component YafN of YafNO toxin-antitoxin module
MAEQFRSITEARKELPSLTQAVQGNADQFVITNQGKPQAVLLGYREYKGLLAAVELLNRPKDLANLRKGLAQTQLLSFEEVRENLRRRRAVQGEAKPSIAVAAAVEAPREESVNQTLDEINAQIERLNHLIRGAFTPKTGIRTEMVKVEPGKGGRGENLPLNIETAQSREVGSRREFLAAEMEREAGS